MRNDELNPLQLIRDYVQELKLEFQNFSKEYHAEILKVWQEIVRIQEQLKSMKDEQKKQAKMWGLIGGAIPATITLAIAMIMYWISKLPPGSGPTTGVGP